MTTIGLSSVTTALGDWVASRHVAAELLRRNLAREYRHSLLGLCLAFVPALVTAAWCTLIRHAHVIEIPSLDIPYPAFVLLSMMLWTTFVEAIYSPLTGLANELPTLARTTYPAEAVVLAGVGEVLFQFCVKSLLIIFAVWWFELPLARTVWLAPLGVLLLVLLGTALGMLLAPVNILYQDISKGLSAVTTFWLFLTPVLFPTPRQGLAGLIVRFNPVTPLLNTTREWIVTSHITQPVGFCLATIATLLLLGLGVVFFRRAIPVLVEHTNA